MLSIFSAIGSLLGGPLTAITGQIAGIFTNKQNVQQAEFASMTAAEQAENIAFVQAQAALNSAKVTNNAHGAAVFMVWLFGLPTAIHWAAVMLVSTPPFSWAGWKVLALPPTYADAELKIALSFFVLAPVLPIAQRLSSRL